MKALYIADLITYLQTLDQTLPIVYGLYSEYCLLELDDLEIKNLCEARPDGWVHDKRKDTPSVTYLVFPGN